MMSFKKPSSPSNSGAHSPMSTLRPIGSFSASAKTTQQPQFAGGHQPTQHSDETPLAKQQPIVQRRIPIPKPSYKTLARQGFREGLLLIVMAPVAMVMLP